MFDVTLICPAVFGAGVSRLTIEPGKYRAKTTVDATTGAPAIGIVWGVFELVVPLRLAHRYFDGWGALPGSVPAVPGL